MAKASDNVFPRFLVSEGGSTSTPAANRVTVYAKADGLLYSKDDAGVEKLMSTGATAGLLNKYDATVAPAVTDDSGDGYAVGSVWVDVTGDDAYICVDATVGAAVWNPFETAGGGGPALYLPATVTPHATYGDDFQGDLSKWTAFGSHNAAADIIAHTGYADNVLRMRERGGGGLYQALPAGDCRLTLIVSGCTTYVGAHMFGVGVWTSGGDGVVLLSYTDTNNYLGGVSGGIWTGSIGAVPNNNVYDLGVAAADTPIYPPWTLQMEFDESEKKARGRISFDGGRTFGAYSSWSSALASAPTRMGIVKPYPNSTQAEVFEVYWFNYEAI